MRLGAFMGLMLCSVKALAAEPLLIPVQTGKPEFPRPLIDARHTGKVRVQLTVAAHGGIQAARIVESSHPQFAEATQRAVTQWRFQPWEVANGAPSSLMITVPILFGARGIEPFSPEITVGLRNTLCAYLSYEVKTSLRNFADEPLSKVDVFWYTREFLSGTYVAQHIPDPRTRSALIVQMENAIPEMVKRCERNPDHPFAKYLPKEVRDVLVEL